MNESADSQLDQVRDVLHVVSAPSSDLVRGIVTANLDAADRTRWYPSLLVEGWERDAGLRQLADDAKGRGVPVVTTRASRGRSRLDTARTLADDWFFIRNTYADVVHVHGAGSERRSPLRWLSPVVPSLPIVECIYSCDGARSSADVSIRRSGRLVTRRSASLEDLEDSSWLWEQALAVRDV